MPLLMTERVDRQLLYLNEGAYAVYIEAADKQAGDPWTRWARNFERCLPLTLWQHVAQPLAGETVERDLALLNRQLTSIASVVGQGRTLLFPVGEYTVAIDKLKQTSPRVAERVATYVASWSKM